MAFRLTKAQLTERDSVIDQLRDALTGIEQAVTAYNAALEPLKADVEKAVAAYNDGLLRARELAEEIYGDADSEILDKSEKWQESDRGQAATEFKDAWQGLNLDDLEVGFPDDLEIEEPTHADEIGDAPEEASQ